MGGRPKREDGPDTVTPDVGMDNAGNADINATVFGCNSDFTSCDADQVLRAIKLAGR